MFDVNGASLLDSCTEIVDGPDVVVPHVVAVLYTVIVYEPAVLVVLSVKSFAGVVGAVDTALYVPDTVPVDVTLRSLAVNPVTGFPAGSVIVNVALAATYVEES